MTANANPNLDYKPLEGYDATNDQVVVAEIDSTTVTTTNGVTHGKLASTASGGGGGGAVTIADGAAVTLGTTTQTKATDGSVTSWSVIQLLKGIFDKLLTTIGVTQSGTWNITNVSGTVSLPTGAATSAKQPALGTAGTPSTDVISVQGVASGTPQPTSAASGQFADGSVATIGLKADAAATDNTSSWTVIALLKGIVGKILTSIAVTQSGTWTVQPGNTANTTAWKVDGSAVTQPASAASGQFVDGSIAAIGTTTQTKATDATTTSWSVVQLLKGILNSLLTSIAVTGTVTANAGTGNMGSNLTQVAGNAIATGNNAVPTLNSASAGAVAAYGSNAAALTANTDYQFKWGAGGTTQVNHVMISNNTGSNISWDDSAATTSGSDTLATGQKLFLDVQTANFHLQATGTPNVNGSSANNIVVKGWL